MERLDIKKMELKISGMSCAMCVKAVETSLGKVEGVSESLVNLGTEIATIYYNPQKVKVKDLEKVIQDAGYGVETAKIIIKIGGMSCAMCVKALEKAFNETEGISSVSVNLGSEKAHLEYNLRILGISDFKKIIMDTGYEFIGIQGEEGDGAAKEAQENSKRNADLKNKKIRFFIGFAIGMFLMALGHFKEFFSQFLPLAPAMLIIALPVFVYTSSPIFGAAWRALKNRNLNMDVMYSMGIGVAFVTSLFSTFGFLSSQFLFYDTAVMLCAFLTLGRYLEAKAKGRTSDAIKKLIGLRPKIATVVRDNLEQEIAVDLVEVDDIVLVRPGDKIPVDGIIVEGKSYVDEAMVTGEPQPALKEPGSNVIGGTINKNSVFKFRATKVGKDTMLSQIIRMVEEAQGSKPPIQKIADKIVGFFIPVVLPLAIFAFFFWYLIYGSTFLFSLTILISILVVACPCALGLATPTAITVGLGRGASLGILIKNGEALEIAEKITMVVFDKTGTLTLGKPSVTEIFTKNITEKSLIHLAALAEKNSSHPLAEAVVRKAQEMSLGLSDEAIAEVANGLGIQQEVARLNDFNTIEGKGVSASINGAALLIGNRALMTAGGIVLDDLVQKEISRLEELGRTTAIIALDQKIIGILGISDPIKVNAKIALGKLKRMKLKVAMLTGDSSGTAQKVSKELGIDFFIAEVLPQDKAAQVKNLQDKGEVVAFVGDGINDAPALAQANVGIAMGSGTDIAIETGDIVLMNSNVEDAVSGIALARKVMQRIKQNLFWAFFYNLILIPVAGGVLYPFYQISFRPEFAGLAMAMSSVTVVTLSLLLKRYNPQKS
jgi:Cu+-exporting ATPase